MAPASRVLPVPARVHPPPATRLALGPRVLPVRRSRSCRRSRRCWLQRGRWPMSAGPMVAGRGPRTPSPPRRPARLRGGGSDEHGGAAAGWRFEAKWDGIRAIAAVAGGAVSLRSRAGNDLTASYPELAELGELLVEHAVVLDGEIVALGRNGAPHFGTLQHRMGVTRARDVAAVRREIEVAYYVFDVLYLDGVSLLRKNYDDRRRVLEAMRLHGEYVSVPDQFPGPASAALAESDRRHLEGIVAKRANSFYEPGKRPGTWIKIKLWRTQDVVVVGWRPGGGRRAGGIGSLLLGSTDPRGWSTPAGSEPGSPTPPSIRCCGGWSRCSARRPRSPRRCRRKMRGTPYGSDHRWSARWSTPRSRSITDCARRPGAGYGRTFRWTTCGGTSEEDWFVARPVGGPPHPDRGSTWPVRTGGSLGRPDRSRRSRLAACPDRASTWPVWTGGSLGRARRDRRSRLAACPDRASTWLARPDRSAGSAARRAFLRHTGREPGAQQRPRSALSRAVDRRQEGTGPGCCRLVRLTGGCPWVDTRVAWVPDGRCGPAGWSR